MIFVIVGNRNIKIPTAEDDFPVGVDLEDNSVLVAITKDGVTHVLQADWATMGMPDMKGKTVGEIMEGNRKLFTVNTLYSYIATWHTQGKDIVEQLEIMAEIVNQEKNRRRSAGNS
jgi:hypothetical protein